MQFGLRLAYLRPCNVLHVVKLASTMAQSVQARAFESRELSTKQQWGKLELGGELLDSRAAPFSEWTVLAI